VFCTSASSRASSSPTPWCWQRRAWGSSTRTAMERLTAASSSRCWSRWVSCGGREAPTPNFPNLPTHYHTQLAQPPLCPPTQRNPGREFPADPQHSQRRLPQSSQVAGCRPGNRPGDWRPPLARGAAVGRLAERGVWPGGVSGRAVRRERARLAAGLRARPRRQGKDWPHTHIHTDRHTDRHPHWHGTSLLPLSLPHR
jgi:hypothetical protein